MLQDLAVAWSLYARLCKSILLGVGHQLGLGRRLGVQLDVLGSLEVLV